MDNILVKTNNLCKYYRKKSAILDLTLSIGQGQIYGLIGKNGAGKTTLLRLITGLANLNSGTIELFGKSSSKELIRVRENIGSLIEEPNFSPSYTLKENLEISRLNRNIAKQDCIKTSLNMVGLGNCENVKFKNLSRGMKQKFGIANAILGNPRLLILDEPINGLDPIAIVEIRKLLLRLNEEQNTTIIISSHILEELSEISSIYGFLDNGRLIHEITDENLKKSCRKYIELVVDNPSKAIVVLENIFNGIKYEVLPNKIKILNFVEKSGSINTELLAKGVSVTSIKATEEKLEEYFIKILGGEEND